MRPTTPILCVNAALLIAGASLAVWQWRAAAAMRAEAETLRLPAGEFARLTAENRRLAALQVPADELRSLRSDHAALARLRADLVSLKDRAEDRIRSPSLQPPEPPGAGPVVPASEWKNGGRATPVDAFETALWAATNGKIDALAAILSIEAPGYDRLQAALTALPEAQRAAAPTPEQFVALAMAKDLSLSSIQVLNQDEDNNLAVRLGSPNGPAKTATFWMASSPEGFQLIVPNVAVQKYLGMLPGATLSK